MLNTWSQYDFAQQFQGCLTDPCMLYSFVLSTRSLFVETFGFNISKQAKRFIHLDEKQTQTALFLAHFWHFPLMCEFPFLFMFPLLWMKASEIAGYNWLVEGSDVIGCMDHVCVYISHDVHPHCHVPPALAFCPIQLSCFIFHLSSRS